MSITQRIKQVQHKELVLYQAICRQLRQADGPQLQSLKQTIEHHGIMVPFYSSFFYRVKWFSRSKMEACFQYPIKELVQQTMPTESRRHLFKAYLEGANPDDEVCVKIRNKIFQYASSTTLRALKDLHYELLPIRFELNIGEEQLARINEVYDVMDRYIAGELADEYSTSRDNLKKSLQLIAQKGSDVTISNIINEHVQSRNFARMSNAQQPLDDDILRFTRNSLAELLNELSRLDPNWALHLINYRAECGANILESQSRQKTSPDVLRKHYQACQQAIESYQQNWLVNLTEFDQHKKHIITTEQAKCKKQNLEGLQALYEMLLESDTNNYQQLLEVNKRAIGQKAVGESNVVDCTFLDSLPQKLTQHLQHYVDNKNVEDDHTLDKLSIINQVLESMLYYLADNNYSKHELLNSLTRLEDDNHNLSKKGKLINNLAGFKQYIKDEWPINKPISAMADHYLVKIAPIINRISTINRSVNSKLDTYSQRFNHDDNSIKVQPIKQDIFNKVYQAITHPRASELKRPIKMWQEHIQDNKSKCDLAQKHRQALCYFLSKDQSDAKLSEQDLVAWGRWVKDQPQKIKLYEQFIQLKQYKMDELPFNADQASHKDRQNYLQQFAHREQLSSNLPEPAPLSAVSDELQDYKEAIGNAKKSSKKPSLSHSSDAVFNERQKDQPATKGGQSKSVRFDL